MQKILIIITGLLFLLSLSQCDKILNGLNSEASYTPLNVGDVTQLIFLQDSSTTLFSIVDKVIRADGKKVYAGVWKGGTHRPDTSYYLVSDGYFKATELDTVKDDSMLIKSNPFREQRLAKSFPEDGDSFIHTVGSVDSNYWLAKNKGTFETLFGVLNEVYAFYLFEGDSSLPFLTTYYGKGIGWIASGGFFSDSIGGISFLCSYKKVSGKVYGELWPEKNPKGFANIQKKKALLNLLGHFSLNNKLKLD